ncbi:MAG: hypothetical protein DHS20C19_02710 [Acidimicrobiales bacterium]|nr:MAG: hypothetical protein DHS20C19_02710 [Acidimicrobiales bacterium]
MRTPLSRVLLVILAVFALVASSCGDDASPAATGDDSATDDGGTDNTGDDGGDDDTRTSDDGRESDGSDVLDGGADDDGGAADDTATDDDMGEDGDMGESTPDADAYCALSVQADEAGKGFNPATMSVTEVEDHWRTQLALIDQARDVVPAEIRDDFALIGRAIGELVDLLEANGWNYFAVLDELDAIFEAPALVAAGERLDAFDADVCGIESDSTGGDGDTNGDDEQAGFDDSPYCQLAFAFSQDTRSIPVGEGPEAIEAFYDDVLDALVGLWELAPEELKAHIDTIGEGISAIYLLLEEHGFDLDAATADMNELTSDPEFNDPMNAATEVLENYDESVCGIV